MAFIQVIPRRKAKGEFAQAYKMLENVIGGKMVPKIVEVFSLRPASMERMIGLWNLSMWVGDIDRKESEMVAVLVSRLNNCHY